MLFNSIEFLFFFPIVFFLYWFVFSKNLKIQNLLILFSSYIFYAWWDWRFLILIFISSLSDYYIGLFIYNSSSKKNKGKALKLSLIVNVGVLLIFKYFNFFIENFILVLENLEISYHITLLNIILPVGISFYTFQTLSYSIDIYNGKMKATKDYIAFFSFVAFFPQLVAGPIERAKNLLPQFLNKRKFEYQFAVSGSRLILIGLLKKMVIADNLAVLVDTVYANPNDFLGFPSLLATIFFTFQIYCDFSGYSDIAIGTSRLFGFDLKQNFANPYFSRDIAEFWRRWHISLSTWFRDYLYIPLGGSRVGTWMKVRNTFVIFLVSGFWHGANWTFIIWGALNAIYFIPLLLTNNNRKNLDVVAQGRRLPTLKEILEMLTTFTLTVFAWIFFRSENLGHAYSYVAGIFSKSFFNTPSFSAKKTDVLITLFLIVFFLFIEWINRSNKHGLFKISNNNTLRRAIYFILMFLIITHISSQKEFIYFQF